MSSHLKGLTKSLLRLCSNELPSSHTQRKYVARLEDLREALENSPFFKTHEVRALGAAGVCGLQFRGSEGREWDVDSSQAVWDKAGSAV